jgi:hypothetical protein
MNDYQLTEYCNDIAADIARDSSDIDQAMDWATESADGSEYVIYTYKAHKLCLDCNTDQGEDFLSECYGDNHGKSYDDLASIIAYGEIQARIQSAIWSIFQDKEDAAA